MGQQNHSNSLFSKQELSFVHDGLPGKVDKWGFVRLGGCGFWLCNARPDLIRTIHRAMLRHPEFVMNDLDPLF